MRREFTLQMYSRPKGRVFSCDTCEIASFHPIDEPPPICPNCSPFLSVYAYPDSLVVVCKWAEGSRLLYNESEAREWFNTSDDIPWGVMKALVEHFTTNKPKPIQLVSPNHVPRDLPITPITLGSVVKIMATEDVVTGDLLLNEHQTPVGVALHDAMTGQSVEVKLTSVGALLTDKTAKQASKSKFHKFVSDLAEAQKDRQYE